MSRAVLVGALVGVAQGLVALLLVVALGAGTDDFGWFASTPQPAVALTVPALATPRQEWLLVPLILAVLGGFAAWLGGLGRPRVSQPPRRSPRRAVAALGALGLAWAIVTVALAPGRGHPGSWVQLGRLAGGMPRRYSDYGSMATASPVGTVFALVLACVLGSVVLVVVVGLADGYRWGRIGTLVVLVLSLVALGVQLFRTGLAPLTLLGELLALGLLVAALLVARWHPATAGGSTLPRE
ncbi:MAG: hypothetical protein ABI181_11880 [Mycobacteriaceae bacterium]